MSASIKTNDLDKMKKPNLLSLGKTKGLPVKQSMKKANLIKLIRNGQNVIKKSPMLENMKKPNLLKLGKNKGLTVKPAMKKSNIIKLIRNGPIKKSPKLEEIKKEDLIKLALSKGIKVKPTMKKEIIAKLILNGPKPPSVDNMTRDELYKYAQSKSIFVPKSYSKQAMLRVIKTHNIKNATPIESAFPELNKIPLKELYYFAKDRLLPVNISMNRNQIIAEILKSPELVKKSTPNAKKPTRYEGWQILEYMAFMYLALKRRSVYHFLLDKDIHSRFINDPSIQHYGILLQESNLSTTSYVLPNYIRTFRTLRKNWLIVPVMLKNAGAGYHANIILYNKSKKHMEYFEPHGFRSMYYVQRTTRFAEKCKHLLKKLSLPIESMEVVGGATCQKGLQSYNAGEYFRSKTGDPGGFCQAWVSWFVDYRLKYPNQNASDLVTKAIRSLTTDPKGFKNFIRSYAEFVVDFMNIHAPNCTVEPHLTYKCKQDLELMYTKVMYFLAPKSGKLM